MRNGDFRARNTLKATGQPQFKFDKLQNSNDTAKTNQVLDSLTPERVGSKIFPQLQSHFNKSLSSPWSVDGTPLSADKLGNSSSIFDFSSPESFVFGPSAATDTSGSIPFVFGAASKPSNFEESTTSPPFIFGVKQKAKEQPQSVTGPIPFVFGSIQKESVTKQPQTEARPFIFEFVPKGHKERSDLTMVQDRSPAEAPALPPRNNEILNDESAVPQRLARPTDAPRFGHPTLPQSPLNRAKLEEKVLIMPKPSRPEFRNEEPKSNHPHLNAVKDFVKGAMHIGTGHHVNGGDPVPIVQPSNGTTFTTTRPAAPQTFGSMGGTYGGFQSINRPGQQPPNFIDLTDAEYRDRLAPKETYSFVDPSKAAADLKALLEGAVEDEDDMPRTRLRKKRADQKAEGLIAKMTNLAVTTEQQDIEEDDGEDDGTIEGIKVKLLPHQIEGVDWMKSRELGTRKKGTVPKGGILADDMGLGKTLQAVSLIITNARPSGSDIVDGKRKFPAAMGKGTLVVAPLALIRQWELEIKDKVEATHALRVIVHHGPQRTKRFEDLKKYDVVITTYQILVSEWGSSAKEADGIKVGCFGLHWYRVILDEAHSIKNRNAKATQACYALRSEYRWCLTGTPMQNNLDELQSLIKFLRIKPYDDLREWKDQIDRPMKNGRGDVAIKRLQHYLKIFMKRRTKDILKEDGALNPGGKPSLPGTTSTLGFKITERKIEKIFAEFTPEERKFYDRLEARTGASLDLLLEGEKVNYASALVLLLRLRQACNHPKLTVAKLAKDSEAMEGGNLGIATPRKSKTSDADVDEMANLFGNLGVQSQKCDVCGNNLSKSLRASEAVRCEECDEDLRLVDASHKSRKEEKHKIKEEGLIKREVQERKPRNRKVVFDSDDEEEGDWLVGREEQGATRLGRAGGTDDENAEGEGISLGSEDSDDEESELPDIKDVDLKKKVISLDDFDGSSSSSESDVEEEYQSSAEEQAKEQAKVAKIITSTKITRLLKILGKESDQHKFIVFSQFTSMLDLIEPFLQRDGYRYTRYDGKMRNDLREASLDRLRNDKSCRILLCSLKCGSLGLNLTVATRVVILEPFWNPFVEEQAIDRVHRLTQTVDVVVYKITITNTVEERILELQEKKRELARQAIESGGKKSESGKLGMKEILQLFRREAEHAPPARGDATSYTIGGRPGLLRGESASASGSGRSSRESSVIYQGERRKEDAVFGRRW